MHGQRSTRRRRRGIGLVVAPLLAAHAGAQGFKLDPGTLIAQDSSGALEGVYHILQFSPSGVELSTLATGYPVPLYGVMVGVTVIGGDVWTIGTGGIVARIDLVTGAMKDTFFTNVYSCEALAHLGSDLLIGSYPGEVHRKKTTGQSVWSFSTGVPMTGITTDGNLIYCGNYQNGHIYVFTQGGALVSVIPTDIGGYALSGLAYDHLTGTLLASTGFGLDEVRRYELNGTPLGSFALEWTYVNDLELLPGACTDLFTPPIVAGSQLEVTGHAPPSQPVALCVALSLASQQSFTVGAFCGASLLSPMFGALQFLTASDAAGDWSVRTPVPPGISLPVHLQAFAGGSCPTACSSVAVSRLIE